MLQKRTSTDPEYSGYYYGVIPNKQRTVVAVSVSSYQISIERETGHIDQTDFVKLPVFTTRHYTSVTDASSSRVRRIVETLVNSGRATIHLSRYDDTKAVLK